MDPVTAEYNQALLELLPAHGIQPIVIPRKEINGQAVSASRVRRLLAEERWPELRQLVPESTYRYLTSDAARPVLASIRSQAAPHGKERP